MTDTDDIGEALSVAQATGLQQGMEFERNRIGEAIADLATGPNCDNEKWKCCGYHDALTDLEQKL